VGIIINIRASRVSLKHIVLIATTFLLAGITVISIHLIKNDLNPHNWLNQVWTDDHHIDNDEWKEVSKLEIAFKGLPGLKEDGEYSRIPKRITSNLRKPLRDLALNTAGGIASFKSNSQRLKVVGSLSSNRSGNMNNIISSGVDIYVDGRFYKSLYQESGSLDGEIIFTNTDEKLIDIYFPLYGNVNNIHFFTEKNAFNSISNEHKGLIIFYGSSITQGCCTSNPGMSYPAIISRKLGIEHINLGFNGHGLGDLQLADFIGELSPSIVVLDYWANPTPQIYGQTLELFIERIRSKLPLVPIIITSALVSPGIEEIQELKNEISRSTVYLFQENGDENIYFVDGLLNLNESEGLIDDRHPNSLGFAIISNRLFDYIDAKNLFKLP
jgi:lysophospholipase L1-like esterase